MRKTERKSDCCVDLGERHQVEQLCNTVPSGYLDPLSSMEAVDNYESKLEMKLIPYNHEINIENYLPKNVFSDTFLRFLVDLTHETTTAGLLVELSSHVEIGVDIGTGSFDFKFKFLE